MFSSALPNLSIEEFIGSIKALNILAEFILDLIAISPVRGRWPIPV